MPLNYALPQQRHNLEFASSGKVVHSSVSITSINRTMTMKHPIDSDGVQSSIVLLGSDHSKKKRQRTMVQTSESNAIENNGSNNNAAAAANTKGNINKTISSNSSSGNESIAYSPRMMALLSSLEALEENEHRKIQQKWPITSSAIPLHPSTSTTQAAATLLQQKQQHPTMGQPLTARPAIHKIEEHPPVQAPASQAKPHTLSTHTIEQVGTRDAFNEYPSFDNTEADTLKRAVAVATATSTIENSASTFTAVNAALDQHRIAGSAVLTAVAAKSGAVFGHIPAISPNIVGTPNFSLGSFSFPAIPSATSTNASNIKYNVAHLNHRNSSLTLKGPTSRQRAIHNAVHNDYKKIYKPLKRPPRLPTAHEALVIAAVSTVTPTPSACR